MKKSELRQLIVESIQEYMRTIDEAGNIAALEAKINRMEEEIQLREEKIGRVNELAELQEFVDPSKINEIKKEVDALKRGKEKYKGQLQKMKNKGKKAPEKEEKKPIKDGKKEELEERKSPLSKKEEETAKKMKPALKSMEKQYGEKKGKSIFYGKVRKETAKK